MRRSCDLVLVLGLIAAACTDDVGADDGETASTEESSDNANQTGDGDGDGDPVVCGYGLGPGGLSESIAVDDSTAHLLTDNQRPNTAEVYCLAGGARSIVAVPGLGLSHYLYLTTPDRRDGWGPIFAANGVTAHIVNPARNVTTADDPDPPNGGSVWQIEDFWNRWGLGPTPPEPYPDVRFPVDDVDDFVAHLPVYGPGPGGTTASQGAIDELTEILEQVGPSVLMLHSAAGPAGFEVARTRPELITALVVVEPTGCPEFAEEVPPLPFLAIYGDYVAERGQSGRFAACQTTRELAEAAGFPAEFMSYPELGIDGNTHVLMQDDNSADIATDILEWLSAEIWD